jgi:hypothetical protein
MGNSQVKTRAQLYKGGFRRSVQFRDGEILKVFMGLDGNRMNSQQELQSDGISYIQLRFTGAVSGSIIPEKYF